MPKYGPPPPASDSPESTFWDFEIKKFSNFFYICCSNQIPIVIHEKFHCHVVLFVHNTVLKMNGLYRYLLPLIFRLMVHGPIFPAVLSMNRVKKHKFPDFAREFPDTAQMTGQAVSVNLIAWLVPTSDHFVPLMVPGNLIQPVMVIFAIPGTVVTGAQEILVGLVTGLLKQLLEVSLVWIFSMKLALTQIKRYDQSKELRQFTI